MKNFDKSEVMNEILNNDEIVKVSEIQEYLKGVYNISDSKINSIVKECCNVIAYEVDSMPLTDIAREKERDGKER